MSLFRQRLLFWVTALCICGFDLASKSWVFERLGVDASSFETIEEFRSSRDHPTERLVGDQVRFVALFNPGMMWGKFGEFSTVLIVLRLMAVGVILYLLVSLKEKQRLAQSALGGILGGAIGNIYDSLVYVGVRDFLEVDLGFFPLDPFPAFNVADSAICCGVACLAVTLWRSGATEKE
jgi:signal peptidase II